MDLVVIQSTTNKIQSTNTSTKSLIFFCFKSISIKSSSGNELLPLTLHLSTANLFVAAKANVSNIRKFMTDIINPDTDKLKNEGFDMPGMGHVSVDFTRSMFDGKMAAILSVAGGASCQLCTATHKVLKDPQLILQGFPINRHISDAI